MNNLWQQIKEVRLNHRRGCLITVIKVPDAFGSLIGLKSFYDYREKELFFSQSVAEPYADELEQKLTEIALNSPDAVYMTELNLSVSAEEEGIELFVQPLSSTPTLFILGAGNIALPLAKFGKILDFQVVVVDDRPDFANPNRFNMADKVICEDFVKAIRQTTITSEHYIVIVTRGHRHDLDCLQEVILSQAAYIGMVGSRRRVAGVKELLVEQGIPQEKVDSIYSPIGLDIGAETPEEIALSIIAEVVKKQKSLLPSLRGKSGRKGELEIDPRVLDGIIEHQRNPEVGCALATIVEVKGSAPRKAGAQMLCFSDGRIIGSIGGGCGEADVRRIALNSITANKPCLYGVDLTNEAAAEEGMACGGVMQVFVQPM